jgi:cephalosporin hydroxylase
MRTHEILAAAGFADETAALARIGEIVGGRGRIPTYLDNRMIDLLRGGSASDRDVEMLRHYARRLSGTTPRFCTWTQREEQLARFKCDTELDLHSMLYSQGAGEVFQWRGRDCFKTLYELALYPMLVAEIRPGSLIELGAGRGGSAAWFADLCKALDLPITIHAVDVQVDDGVEGAIRYHRRDCIDWVKATSAERRDPASPLIVIEDFHGDMERTLAALDDLLQPGDYLVIEDAIPKQSAMARSLRERPYVIDTRYTDFFGINCTSAINGILKRV